MLLWIFTELRASLSPLTVCVLYNHHLIILISASLQNPRVKSGLQKHRIKTIKKKKENKEHVLVASGFVVTAAEPSEADNAAVGSRA